VAKKGEGGRKKAQGDHCEKVKQETVISLANCEKNKAQRGTLQSGGGQSFPGPGGTGKKTSLK